MPRPRKHADEAAKMRAYRAAHNLKTFDPGPRTAEAIERIAREQGRTESEVIANLCKFALLNRNWLTLGLISFKKET